MCHWLNLLFRFHRINKTNAAERDLTFWTGAESSAITNMFVCDLYTTIGV